MEPVDLTILSLDQLKVLAYDELSQMNIHQRNVQLIENRINQLVNKPQEESNGNGATSEET